MSVTLERKQVIELLDKLGSDKDEDALAAARMLHKQIAESGMSWDDLLVGDGPEVEEQAPVETLPSEGDENDNIEEAKRWAVGQKQSLIKSEIYN